MGRNQKRTSTIWPLKISNAFAINGSFLKSSLLNGTDASFSLGWTGAGTSALAVANVTGAFGAGTEAGRVFSDDSATRGAGASAFTNLIWGLEWPSSCSLV